VSEEPEEERVCSTLRWDDVRLPQAVSEADLDALIFHELAQNWRKVARVVGRAKEGCDARSLSVVASESISKALNEMGDRAFPSNGFCRNWVAALRFSCKLFLRFLRIGGCDSLPSR
jgi:hypothetical protein